jgi:hypothetical protein
MERGTAAVNGDRKRAVASGVRGAVSSWRDSKKSSKYWGKSTLQQPCRGKILL